MKKAGIGAVLGLAIFATSQTAQAAATSNVVVIPYFSSKAGMFTALSYVYHDDTAGTQTVHFYYYYKPDLTQGLNNACTHFDGQVETTANDLDTILIDGTGPNVEAAIVDDAGVDGIAPPINAEGFVALKAADGDTITAEAHIVVTATRGVYSFRALQTDDNGATTYNFINTDTIDNGSTTVMFYPESIADTYLYIIADGGDFDATSNYTAVTEINLNGKVYNRSEQEFSLATSESITCAAVIHIRDLMTDAVWNSVRNTGGWFSLTDVDATAGDGAVVYKIEISPTYGATVTPQHPQTYVK